MSATPGAADGRGSGGLRDGGRPAPRTPGARLRLSGADPWSVMTTSFLISVTLGLCSIVTVALLWVLLTVVGAVAWRSLGWALALTAGVAVVEVALTTALATLAAFLYNMSAGLVGGVELTATEDE
ncbi:DUF3566 domain-containing protein [Streptomyces cynarae]|uniref:DUF3566 domain-containing protein n=1 Tax=Streptomyces cynarae TaxID=2981134 RepID=A0ABY6EBU5_9ACTN|nr:DUF3566 domain-containing protein [Streptomyces cynarae]UXY23276.1 DUF3566 domain-containing protein [Streptomyces cynarae]